MGTLHSTELFLFSRRHNPTKNAAPFSANKHTHTHSISSDEGLTLETSAFKLFTVALSTQLVILH